ncbi:hypothetical protein RHSIM_Rhsim01G0099700 [Rhododendron simsii]|uniref:ATP-dependent DNA helicase n=1 Tax=Rhododendron simsii TaxID=118357 RepID=A0A834M0L4_RHOSS|nr:hypothetical protein RHSIM_Rhsim01G0099700 [Rhododendron simsii]
MVLGSINEIQQYLDARYIGPPEAAWRISGHHLHEEVPAMVQLALHLPGMHQCPKSFEDLRTFNYVLHDTFKSTCVARGVLEDDEEWVQCLQEAAIMKTGNQLRRLFSIILTQCSPIQPYELWKQFAVHICDDIAHKIRTCFPIPNPSDAQIEDYGLYLRDQMLQESGRTLSDFPPMPQLTGNWSAVVGNKLVLEHQHLQIESQQVDVQMDINRLNSAQCKAYDVITSSILQNRGKIFFVSGGAGTGRHFYTIRLR